MKKCTAVLLLVAALLLSVPVSAHAFIPFGGRVLKIIPCNTGILTTVGPPRGGEYMWLPSTRTYLYGPPSHPGQALLGIAAPPTPCFVGKFLVGVGLGMILEGSSAI